MKAEDPFFDPSIFNNHMVVKPSFRRISSLETLLYKPKFDFGN